MNNECGMLPASQGYPEATAWLAEGLVWNGSARQWLIVRDIRRGMNLQDSSLPPAAARTWRRGIWS